MTRPYPPKPGKSAVIYTTPYPGGPGRQQTDDPEIALFAIDSTSLDIGAQVAAKMSHVEMAVIVGDLKQATEWINGEEGKLAASYATTISLAKIGNTG